MTKCNVHIDNGIEYLEEPEQQQGEKKKLKLPFLCMN